MAEEDDDSQKTEEPTQKRLDDAIKKGQVIYSKEVTSFLMLFCITITILTFIPYNSKKVSFWLQNFFSDLHVYEINDANVKTIFITTIKNAVLPFFLPLFLIMVIAILSSLLQSGHMIFSFDPISPKWEKLSPLKGLKRMFSVRSLIEFFKGLVKITFIGIVLYLTIYPDLNKIITLHELSEIGIMAFLLSLIGKMLIATCIIFGFIGISDYFYQRYQYFKSMMMSKEEIKEEYKQMEGNPEVKAKLKQLRTKRAKQRMMANVPKADVIITNPTHFSVALEYKEDSMRAPKVIAKGQDLVALKIREIAKFHNIPLVENKQLARALYANAELDEEIPLEYYKAVAEVISYVYKIKGKR